jgi:hypothetical protein
MQQTILDHVADVVRPALRKYSAAEESLSDALRSGDAGAACTARQDVMLAARQAANVLHHLSDFVLKESPPRAFADIRAVRRAVEARCVDRRSPKPIADVELLRDVADAFKHHRPDRPSATVVVSTDVLSVGSGWDQARWDEAKWDAVEQVIITTKNGDKRALSSVLQNVFDAWMTLLGQPLPLSGRY